MSPAKASPLRQLADIISSSVDKIDAHFDELGLDYPSLDIPWDSASPSELASMSPEVVQASMLVVSACAQLSATVHNPSLTLFDAGAGFHVSSALRAALQGNTVEILRGNPQGLSAKEIAAKNGMDSDPARIARVLRLLATHYIFTETSPDVFRNNRLSSMMDTLKSVDEIKANPQDKHVGTPGIGAWIEMTADEVMKASAYMTDVLFAPEMGKSEAPEDAPLQTAFRIKKTLWAWLDEPGNEYRLKRLNVAQAGTNNLDPPNAILMGFKWDELPPNAIVVDVGGGMGHLTMRLAKNVPNLKYIVQDRPSVIEQGRKFWKENLPSAIESGDVQLQDHNFFDPQPVTNASVFMLRLIIHDYGPTNAARILRNLRDVATPDTKLVLIEQVVPYACTDENESSINNNIPGARESRPPPPLLANLGKASAMGYLGDLQMYVALNGDERTLGMFCELTKRSGWNIVEIFSIPGSVRKQIVAVPA